MHKLIWPMLFECADLNLEVFDLIIKGANSWKRSKGFSF
jgi:hypothetical protein